MHNGPGAILFDKDGTLFDFTATWAAWAAALMDDLAADDPDHATQLGAAIGFDAVTHKFAADSPAIAGTPYDLARILLPLLPDRTETGLVARMNALAAQARMVEAVPLAPLLAELRKEGLRIGLATNDAEMPARSHLLQAGVLEAFDFVAGCDSGFGAKPAPGMLHAFAGHVGLAPAQVVMVGDSTHDLHAGRAAGMICVGVLTGPARHDLLAPFADAVLPDIGYLPDWLASRRAG